MKTTMQKINNIKYIILPMAAIISTVDKESSMDMLEAAEPKPLILIISKILNGIYKKSRIIIAVSALITVLALEVFGRI